MYFIILGVFTAIGFLVQSRLKSKFKRYSQVPMDANMTGAQVAQTMLDHYGISGVQIVQGQGFLSDHYNPRTKTVSLSPDVYAGNSVAAAAVAAHECGHVVQHAKGYSMLQMRSGLVPVMQFSANIQQFLFMGMMFGLSQSSSLGNILMLALVATFGMTALFSLVTLPVEFDASNRALAWLEDTGIVQGAQYDGAKDALWWAAMTYVAKALGALVMFLYFLLNFLGSRD